MPATEETLRNTRILHVVFGLTGLAMLIGTVWMLGADYVREWRPIQRQYQKLEAWSAESRVVQEDTAEYSAKQAELSNALTEVRSELPSAAAKEAFLTAARPLAEANKYSLDGVEAAYEAVLASHETLAAAEAARQAATPETLAGVMADLERARASYFARRDVFTQAMRDVTARAIYIENSLSGQLKFRRADLDAARSPYDLGVGGGLPASQLAAYKEEIDRVQRDVDQLSARTQDAKAHRLDLEKAMGEMLAPEIAARKALDDHTGQLAQLHQSASEQEVTFVKRLAELPIIDGFSPSLQPKQIWLPQLTLYNNFKEVARFDRCTTCHLGMEKTAAGSAVEPGYKPITQATLTMPTPETAPGEAAADGEGTDGEAAATTEPVVEPTVQTVYGLAIADHGLFNANDSMVQSVWPNSLAAQARLEVGDVIEGIRSVGDANFAVMDSVARTKSYLLNSAKWGTPLELQVRRGVPQPFTSHPRLDLFIGSTSPHKMGEFGCTICHQGQGSATEFKWASHTPNSVSEGDRWKSDHKWFNNHHWIYPQLPERLIESSCLKCHHDVVELEPSERFPEPPAPKVVQGYHTIRQVGCFGCHEINGFDGPARRIGPDLRAEPNYFAAAQQLLATTELTEEEQRLAHQVVDHPETTADRKLLAEMINGKFAKEIVAGGTAASEDESAEDGDARPATMSASVRELVNILNADDETPGKFRKVGPSLRHVASKLDEGVLYRWIRRPQDIRPSSKMPQFFGLYDHLPQPLKRVNDRGETVVDDAARFEPVELRAITEYLVDASQPFEYLEPEAGVTLAADIDRGRQQFETRGCLACHQHGDFPAATGTQGPDLSQLNHKLTGEKGQKWLYSWVREPNRYHARTVMPNVFLEPITSADGVSDSAADITAYLLSTQTAEDGSQGHAGENSDELPAVNAADLNELTLKFLETSFSRRKAMEYVETGIPESLADELRGDERVLLGSDDLEHKKLLYVGRRTISRYGCSACHDIPGFEGAKPIGTALNDWGRKETSKLAFEQILTYLSGEHGDPHAALADHAPVGAGENQAAHAGDASVPPNSEHAEDAGAGHGHFNLRDMPASEGFFMQSLLHHEREGFIWQKLREPRSYDYKKTETKGYLDRLRMPKFNLDEAEREAVITFVLGLVVEPPAARYVYQPSERQKALQAGQELLTKYNCAGCHTTEMESWTFDYDPNEFAAPPAFTDYAFLKPHFTPQELAASKAVDRRGLGTATVSGMVNPTVGEDDDGNPVYYFAPWKHVAINGEAWAVGGQDIEIPESRIVARRPAIGGEFARMLHPVALEQGQQANPNLLPSDVWGWLPPPLVREGEKVQPDWLHDFLLAPYPIRPAAVLRMPKFNMSSEEATVLVDYFAAKDNAHYPYTGKGAARVNLSTASDPTTQRLDDALRIVTNNNYCVKCHLVGDYVPPGSVAALAPNLDRVYQRMRPEYLRDWIANPKRLLPYTGMPVNFPADKPSDPAIFPDRSPHFPATSVEQVESVVQLLMNYDNYMKAKLSIDAMVPDAPPAEEGAAAADLEAAATDADAAEPAE